MRQAALVGRNRAGAVRPAPPGGNVIPFPRRRRFRRHPPYPIRKYLLALLIGLTLSLAIWEAQTSSLQSWFFGRWSATLNYTIDAGPTPQMAFPVSGPFDQRRGYTRIPVFRDSLEAYSNPHLTIADFGYLLNTHPLELWGSGELARNPQTSWNELLARSLPARHMASEWLFKTRNHKAQDLRLRIRFERDAFARMTPYWRKLGSPSMSSCPPTQRPSAAPPTGRWRWPSLWALS